MNNLALSLALVVCVATASSMAARLPEEMKRCKRSDENFNECLKDAIQSSIPQFANGKKSLGVPKIEPLHISSVHISGNGGQVDLDQIYNDVYVYGLTKTIINSVTADISDGHCNVKIEGHCPSMVMETDLKLAGKMLLFTLNGGGKSKITIDDLKASMEMTCERVEKDGETYVHFSDYQLDMSPTKLSFEIANLVDGNEQLSEEIVKVMNENNLEIFKELKPDYEKSFATIFMQIANEVFSRVPEDEIFLK